MPELSIIIPTRDREKLLADCLQALARQSRLGEFEVIIADDNRAGPVRIPSALPFPVISARAQRRGAAPARMAAAAVASAQLLGFLDDDAVPDPDWVEVVLARRNDLLGGNLAITGRILPLQDRLLSRARQARYDARQEAALARGGACDFLAGGNAVISAKTFHAAGGFDCEMDMMHDAALLAAIVAEGGRCEYDPHLVIRHLHVKSAIEAVHNAYRSGGHRLRILHNKNETIHIPREITGTIVKLWPFSSQGLVGATNAALNLVHLLGASIFKLSAGRWPR